MAAYSVTQAKAQLSEILNAVERGEDVVVTKHGKPIARISSLAEIGEAIYWEKIDAFRARLKKKTKASVPLLRARSRY